MKISRKRIDVSMDRLLAPLPVGDGVGEYLRYDPVYDQIREARKEEDDSLSQGIWQHDLKKADYVLMEQLCSNILEFRSKDLQVIGWLIESWMSLDGLFGFSRGLEILSYLCKTYWANIYPQDDDGDFEARIRLFEWMNEQFANRLMMIPLTYHSITQEKSTLTLADWIAALNTETVAKRSVDYAKNISEAEAKGKVKLSVFRRNLQTTDARYLQKNYTFCQKSIDQVKEIFEFLAQKLGKQSSSFNRIKTCLDDILRICKSTLDQRNLSCDYKPEEDAYVHESFPQEESTSVEPSLTYDIESLLEEPTIRTNVDDKLPDDVRTISGRREAYQALKEIGQFLQSLDPHSPAPALLEMIVAWENKSLPSILEDLSNAPSNTQVLIKMLASSLSSK